MPLPRNAPASAWIHDFVHSDNEKFKGKSRKERIRMALGAYYGKQHEEYVPECEALYEADHSGSRVSGQPVHQTFTVGKVTHYGDPKGLNSSCPHCLTVYKQELKAGLSHRESQELTRHSHELGHPEKNWEEYMPEGAFSREAGKKADAAVRKARMTKGNPFSKSNKSKNWQPKRKMDEANNFHDSLNCRACKHIVKKHMDEGKPFEHAHAAAMQHSIAFPHMHGSYATDLRGKMVKK